MTEEEEEEEKEEDRDMGRWKSDERGQRSDRVKNKTMID